MARRKRFSLLMVGTAVIVGVALYLPGSAPFINGIPVGSGYGGANCPVGISFDVTPSTVLYGGSVALSGHLVSGPSPSVPLSSQTITITRVDSGTATTQATKTTTTDSSGAFSTPYAPRYSAFYTATWSDPHELCPDVSSGDNASVREIVGIASTKTTAVTGGTTFTVYGGVRPNKAGKTINLQFRAIGSNTWTIFTITLNSHSNFSQLFFTRRHGVTFIFRAVYRAQDQLNLGNVTPFIVVNVS